MKKSLLLILAVLSSLFSDGHGSIVRPETLSSNVAIADPPIANDDVSSNNIPGNMVSVQILSNDLASTGGSPVPFFVTVDMDISTPGVQMSLTVPGEGAWYFDGIFFLSFYPEAGFSGNPTPITYSLTENATGLSDLATVTITYINQPIASNDVSNNNAPGVPASVAILSNDLLANGSTPQPSDVSVDIDLSASGIQGVLVVPGEGTWSYNSTTGLLTFTAQSGFAAAPTPISYTLTTSANFVSDPATVTIGYGTLPVATDDVSSNNVTGTNVSIQILANDLSSSGLPASPLSVTIDVDILTLGNQSTLIVPGEGIWLYDLLGTFTFVPEIGLTRDPTPITYTLTDNLTGLSDQAKVTVGYQKFVKANNDIESGAPGSTVTISILSNDFLANGSTPAPTDVTVDIDPSTSGIQTNLFVPGEGSWVYSPIGGWLIFNPDFNFFAVPTPITYTLTEGANNVSDPATVVITFAGKPAANDDASLNNTPGTAVPVQILMNDLLSNGGFVSTLTATIDIDASKPGNQSTLTVPNEGFWMFDGVFMLNFFPLAGLTSNPTPITYTLTDKATGLSDQATVTVTYLFKPVATNDVSSNNTPGVPVSIAILSNDFLTNGSTPGPLDVSVDIDLATPGTQVILPALGQGTWNYNPGTGLLTFTPTPGFTTAPTPITYTLTDALNDVSNPATVTISYPAMPRVTDDVSNNNTPGTMVSVLALANDGLSNGLPAFPFMVTIDLDVLAPGTQSTLIVPGEGTWLYDLAGTFTFVPEAGLAGDPTPLTYTLTENGTGLSGQATITISYRKVLTATNDIASGTPGSTVTIPILSNDFLADSSTPTPADVTVDIDPTTSGIQSALAMPGQGAWAYDTNTGILTFTPEAGFPSSPTAISYTLTDVTNYVSAPAFVVVTIGNKPIANDDVSSNNIPGSIVSIPILANDLSSNGLPFFLLAAAIDLDASTPGNQSSLIVPGEGVWTFDGILMLNFVPDAGLGGDPTPITYTVTDNATGLSDQAVVTVQYLVPPVADSREVTISTPSVGFTLTLDGQNGRPAPLSGNDAQDGSLGAGKTFAIVNIDGLNGNTLLYNDVPITTSPFTISNYDPSLLAVKFAGVGSTSLSFNYLVTDSQGLSSTEVAYKLKWESPMPVTLISFGVKAEGNRVVLSWATSEESNSDHFEVQRSDDGITWQPLDQVAAAGESSSIRRYTFTDEHPLDGQNLFRLKMVDMDHSYTYSQIRSVQVMGGEKITMSPNPVSDMLTIDLPSWKKVSALTIFDQSGRKRSSVQSTAKAKIDMRHFPAGIYVVVIHYSNGTTYSQRVMVK